MRIVVSAFVLLAVLAAQPFAAVILDNAFSGPSRAAVELTRSADYAELMYVSCGTLQPCIICGKVTSVSQSADSHSPSCVAELRRDPTRLFLRQIYLKAGIGKRRMVDARV